MSEYSSCSSSTPPRVQHQHFEKKKRKPKQPAVTVSVPLEDDTPFRIAERYWKSKAVAPDLRRAFDVNNIVWETTADTTARKMRGTWTDAVSGGSVQVYKVPLMDLEGRTSLPLGQSKWKGKSKSIDDHDYAIIVPSIPGLVLLPRILPERIQRDLTKETLLHSKQPNDTSLSRHYVLPQEGIWQAWLAGKSDEPCERKTKGERVYKRERIDFEPVTMDNFMKLKGRGDGFAMHIDTYKEKEHHASGDSLTVKELIPKIRWTTIGYTYDWTSKAYDFDKPYVPLPPLVYSACKDVVRSVPWSEIFDSPEEGDWDTWNETYEPEAGVINYYQLKDMLTGHIDQSEVDAVRPLVSYSIGNSAVFLIGGPTRDTPPLPILLRSGDGLLMSGKRGRRNFHGLPRVFADTLPDYLKPDFKEEDDETDWEPYGRYLAEGARININVREVFPRDKPNLSTLVTQKEQTDRA